jgi:hypothetical protein
LFSGKARTISMLQYVTATLVEELCLAAMIAELCFSSVSVLLLFLVWIFHISFYDNKSKLIRNDFSSK